MLIKYKNKSLCTKWSFNLLLCVINKISYCINIPCKKYTTILSIFGLCLAISLTF